MGDETTAKTLTELAREFIENMNAQTEQEKIVAEAQQKFRAICARRAGPLTVALNQAFEAQQKFGNCATPKAIVVDDHVLIKGPGGITVAVLQEKK